MKRPLGAQISHMLNDRGVEVIFGIPGVHNQEMYRGIEESGLRHILARNEQGAGFMADGYARATGKPGVAYVITGPGLCNIMNPMGQAYSDSVPMLVISSCLDETAARYGQLHQMKDQEIAAQTVCEWSCTAQSAEAAYQLVDRALAEFTTSRARPKHIQVPIKLLQAQTDPALPRTLYPVLSPGLDAGLAARIAHDLQAARKPLFVLGGGAKDSAEYAERVIQSLGAAVFSTYAGRGLVAPDYRYNFGANLARPESAEICAEADLVIAIGSELSEVDIWRDHLGHTCPMIRVDIDPSVLATEADCTRVLCDADAFLKGLDEIIPQAPEKPSASTDWSADEVAAAKLRWRQQTDAERPGVAELVDALRTATPPDVMVYSDMTQFAYVALELFEMDRPGHWHHPSGFGTLGYALPAAIGGKIGRPDLPVISINGDSGFQYNVQELATAVELGLSLPIIVWDNGKLKEIEDSMVSAQIAPNAVIARNPDFCKLAEAYGAQSAAPRSLSEFQDAVQSALKADGPTLIHVTPQTARR